MRVSVTPRTDPWLCGLALIITTGSDESDKEFWAKTGWTMRKAQTREREREREEKLQTS